MAKFLLLSHRHGLLPLANHLLHHQQEVIVCVYRERYRRCWRDRLQPQNPDEILSKLKDELGDWVVVSDHPSQLDRIPLGVNHWGTTDSHPKDHGLISLGGWINELASHESCTHLVISDLGLGAGGQGPLVEGAVTLVRCDLLGPLLAAFTQAYAEARDRGLKGLLRVFLENETLEMRGWTVGWHSPHWDVFAAEAGDFSAILSEGELPTIPVLKPYSVGVVLSVPPWPHVGNPKPRGGTPVPSELSSLISLHDVRVNMEERTLSVAGADGLVGVATSSDVLLALAVSDAVETCKRAQLPEGQYRWDAGSQANLALTVLLRGGLVRLV